MGHTNSTANLALPQFIGTDKPTWLSDVNGAFAAIDTYAGNNDAALAITDAKADTAIGDAASAVTTAGNAATTAGNAAATATAANTVAGNALTVANGINSKVGVLTDLHTTDKSTVVAAINEVADASGVFPGAMMYDDATQEFKYWDDATQAWVTISISPTPSSYAIEFVYPNADYTTSYCTYNGNTYSYADGAINVPGLLTISNYNGGAWDFLPTKAGVWNSPSAVTPGTSGTFTANTSLTVTFNNDATKHMYITLND